MADRTVAVDFDGVIHAYGQGWHDGSIYDGPISGALDGLRKLMEHYAVFIHTSRDSYSVAQWLDGHGIPAFVELESAGRVRDFWTERDRVLVTNRKLPAVAYLDDRAVRFTSWGQALRELLPGEARPSCCRCDPALCESDESGDHCATAGCAYCLNGCPATDRPCCKEPANG